MNVGVLEIAGALRQNQYWSTFLRELGLDPIQPHCSDASALEMGAQILPNEPLSVQLALGRLLDMQGAETVLLPQWEAVTGDMWGEALSELLPRRISSLPQLLSVPNEYTELEALESAAVQVGLQLLPNAGKVKLALERARPLAPAAKKAKTDWPVLSVGSLSTFGVIGSRALLEEPLLMQDLQQKLADLQVNAVYGCALPRAEVLKRAERLEDWDKRTLGDRLIFGAASLLGAKSAVRGLIFVHSAADTATMQMHQKLAQKLHKPKLFWGLQSPQVSEQATRGELDWAELAQFVQAARGAS